MHAWHLSIVHLALEIIRKVRCDNERNPSRRGCWMRGDGGVSCINVTLGPLEESTCFGDKDATKLLKW